MMSDPHFQLCINEHIEPNPLPCHWCGKESDAYASDDDGWVCKPCIIKDESGEEL